MACGQSSSGDVCPAARGAIPRCADRRGVHRRISRSLASSPRPARRVGLARMVSTCAQRTRRNAEIVNAISDLTVASAALVIAGDLAVPGFTGFVLGLVGIDLCLCRWGSERTRYALSVLRIPGWRSKL